MNLQDTLRALKAMFREQRASRPGTRTLIFEPLSQRKMLAVTAIVDDDVTGVGLGVGQGVLFIQGDADANTITVSVNGGNVEVNAGLGIY